MREIRSPLDGIPSPFAARAALDAYLVGAYKPKVVADFAGIYSANEYYRTGGSASTFANMFSYTGASNKTMVDSDGKLKWAPHNLALNSAAPATQSITVVSGADYTVEITGSGSVALSGAGSGTVTAGNPVEITASTTTLTLTVTGTPTTMWAYRSDLGGMVNNPDRNDSYVPTTSSAVYLPRRNHYGWNGSSYVNKGLLLETESRTNVALNSNDFADLYWVKPTGGQLGASVVGPDGVSGSAVTLEDNGASGTGLVYFFRSFTVATSTTYTASIFAKEDQLQWLAIRLILFTTPPTPSAVWFDLNNGVKGTETNITGNIEPYGDGWYRCSVTFTTDAVDTTGNIQFFCCDSDNDTTVDLDGTSSILIYGAQLEAGSTPSSYMPTTGSTFIRAAETLTIPAAKMAWDASNVSLQMQGEIVYADEGITEQQTFVRWHAGATDYITYDLDTDSTDTGEVNFNQEDATGGAGSVAIDAYTPGTDGKAAYNISGRHTSTAINGATDGTATTEDTTPTALPDLSTTDFKLGYDYMGTIALFREDNNDWGDAGIAEAST